tara:strand:- start:1788 stop:1946 length:159 start_codon:yes stop_codon:yes gene_type:complete
MTICHNCKGNGYVKVNFECEETILQCKVCNSQGEILDWLHDLDKEINKDKKV